jgi:hypothetical protein
MQAERIGRGTAVRFTKGPLGGGAQFEHTVNRGDVGKYSRPHPAEDLPDWHIVECEQGGETFEVPAARAQFEVIEGGES